MMRASKTLAAQRHSIKPFCSRHRALRCHLILRSSQSRAVYDLMVLTQTQRGLVRRPEARPQRRAFLGMGFSSRHELAGEYTRR